MTYNVPTILIGLGGIGGQVVNDIYGRIPESSRSRVAIHALDTDVNSLRKLEHLKDHVTQTSTTRSVGEYLAQNATLKSWFPENPQLNRKTMTEGAGQIRAVSRLAFRAALEEGKIKGLWESINSIFPIQRDRTIQGVRVIILSSLAGGTGSGIFLQVAMYLREMLERRFGQSSVLIRGAFLLPDLFVRTGILDNREWESVQANGYASMKELNAITLSAAGKWSQREEDGITIELEYRPDQVDLEGRITHAVTEKQLPFDFCFLYDYENLKGQHLHGFSDYLQLVTRTIYLQLFSPMSTKHFSQEDNQILELISSEGKGRFCGAGVASLTYPYEDIVEYCALQRSVHGLNDNWLQLDLLFEEELDRYELDMRRGVARDKPDRGDRFIWHLDQLYNDERPQPFITQVYRQAYEELEKGQIGDAKSELFVKKMEEYVYRLLEEDTELRVLEGQSRINEGKLAIKAQIKQEIGRVESQLSYYQEQINKKIYEYRTFAAHQIIEQDMTAQGTAEGQEYRLNTWFLRKPEPIHPIAVRYMLYKIRAELRLRIQHLRTQNQAAKQQIDKYPERYSLSDRERTETAQQRVDMALKQSLLSGLYKNQLKDFKEEYMEKASRQLTTLTKYEKSMLLELVLISVSQAIEQMCRDWERFFDNLKDTRLNLMNELDRLEKKYANTDDTPHNYILASAELLQQTWEGVRRSFDNDSLPQDVAGQIYKAHYIQYCRRNENRLPEELQPELKVEALYRHNVLAYLREDVRVKCSDRLDIDVTTALMREAASLQKDYPEYLHTRVLALTELASPFIPSIPSSRELKFWGTHPDSLQQLAVNQRLELFGEKAIADKAFSRYELICYRAHYGLSVQDFDKFSSGNWADTYVRPAGEYYSSYKRRIDRLNRNEPMVTPHLDRRWHVPANMPDLNPKQAELDNRRSDRALILGLIYQWLIIVNTHGKYLYQYNDIASTRLIYRNGKEIGGEIYSLHRGLLHNPIICEEILERAQEELKQNKKKHSDNLIAHPFIQNSSSLTLATKPEITNILDALLYYEMEDTSRLDLHGKANDLRGLLLEEIEAYFMQLYGDHRSVLAKRAAVEFIGKLWDSSAVRQSVDLDSTQYNNWRNLIDRKLEHMMRA
jgi:hypothetical protein